MKTIRQTLLQQYVGAITIGFLIAMGISSFVNTLVQCTIAYWDALEASKTNYRLVPHFPWNNLIGALVAVTLDLLVAYGLVRWLYISQKENSGSTSTETNEL